MAACSGTPDVDATSSPSATPVAESPSGAPALSEQLGGVELAIQDPGLRLLLPDGWREQTLDEVRAEIEQAGSDAGVPADVRAYVRSLLDDGVIRAGAVGHTDCGVEVRLTIMVIDGL